MSDRHKQLAEELLSVRPVTRDLITSILMDAWPSHTAIVDFGIDSQTHYEALYYPIREAEIMPKDLDAALGDGPKLTAMLRDAPSNPHKDVEFQTSLDILFGRGAGGGTGKDAREAFNEVLHGKTQGIESAKQQLLGEIETLTGRAFVYEDGWGGMVPYDGSLSEMQTGPPVPFTELDWRDQVEVLREFVHWKNYPARDWHDEYVIRDNIAGGKPSEQWLHDTSLRESFQLLADGKTPRPQQEYPELSEHEVRAAMAELLGRASDPQAKEGHEPERGSAATKAFANILRNDQPREAATQTPERSGWEI